MSLLFAVVAMTAHSVAAQQGSTGEPEWLLVHGDTQRFGSLSVQRIGEIYLAQQNWGSCHARDFRNSYEGSVLVVGTLAEVPLASALTDVSADDPEYLGRKLGPGLGLVIASKREGGNRFCVFTGVDDDAVFQCMTTPVQVNADRAMVVRAGQVMTDWPDSPVVRGGPGARSPAVHAPGLVALEQLVRAGELVADPLRRAEAVDRAARAQIGYSTELALLGGGDAGGANWIHGRLRQAAQHDGDALLQAAAWLDGLNMQREIQSRWHLVEQQLGPARQPAPAVFVLLNRADATNARTSDFDSRSQRPRVVLNISSFDSLQAFRVALVHEFVHVLQFTAEGTLPADSMLTEGVASYLTQQLMPQITAAQALMWSDEQYEIASRYEVEAAQGYRSLRDSGSSELARWFQLGVPSAATKAGVALPDRLGYFLGYRAAQSWHATHSADGSDVAQVDRRLLSLKAGDLMPYLPDKQAAAR